MKKRLLALTLVMALGLTLVIPALMNGDIDAPTITSLPLDYLIEVPASGTSIAPYAIISAEDWKNPTSKITWKDFKATDIMLDGKIDVTKIVSVIKKPSYLIVPNDFKVITKGSNLINAPTMASFSSLGADYIAYNLAEPEKKPSAPKPTFKEDADGKVSAVYTFTDPSVSLQYRRIDATNSPDYGWKDVVSPLIILLEEYKVVYQLRTKPKAGSTATSMSSPIKITVPALANAPSTKLNTIKGEIKIKKDWIIKVGAASYTSIAAKTFNIGETTNLEEGFIGSNEDKIEYRVKTAKKPGSSWATLYLKTGTSDGLGVNAYDYFSLAAGNKINIVGTIPIQIETTKGTNTSWKTVKSIKYTDFTFDKDGVGTIKVRVAGTKSKLPSASKTLQISKTGVLSFT